MGLLSSLFGKKKRLQEALEKGATIIDVRTKTEFKAGNAPGSVNIPLDQIDSHIKKIKQAPKPILVCCASGMRSGNAKMILQNNGVSEVINAGSWLKVNSLLN